jgi:hypothetical protein
MPSSVGDLEKRNVAPAGVAVQILDLGDFHWRSFSVTDFERISIWTSVLFRLPSEQFLSAATDQEITQP